MMPSPKMTLVKPQRQLQYSSHVVAYSWEDCAGEIYSGAGKGLAMATGLFVGNPWGRGFAAVNPGKAIGISAGLVVIGAIGGFLDC